MNGTQALTRIRKLLGPKAAIQDTRRASSAEMRAALRAKRIDVNARSKAACEAMDARKAALLAADPEYQRLKAAHKAVRDEQDRTSFGNDYRYTAGTNSSLFFHVEAQADTLAELVEAVEAKRKAAA